MDLTKQHPAVRLQLPAEHEIAYYLVGDRGGYHVEVPAILQSPMLHFLPQLPKSGLQFLDPIAYQRQCLSGNSTQAVRFSVIFSDKFIGYFASAGTSPFLSIFLWSTFDAKAIASLAQFSGSKLVLPSSENLAAELLRHGIPSGDVPPTFSAIVPTIEERLLKLAEIPRKTYAAKRKSLGELADTFFADQHPRATLPFGPTSVNVGQLNQIFGQFGLDQWSELHNDPKGRAADLAKIFKVTATALAFTHSMVPKAQNLFGTAPSAILAFPSVSPVVETLWKKFAEKLPAKAKRLAASVRATRFSEQDRTSYICTLPRAPRKYLREMIQIGARGAANYTRFFDGVGYLHASFRAAPYLRGPLAGGSLAQQHRQFSPVRFKVETPAAQVKARVAEFGESLAQALDPALLLAIKDYAGGVVAMSDLPLEWMAVDGVPLCFAKDVCRLPEGMVTNLMAQFAHNSVSSFRVRPDLLSRTLVICGAMPGDPVHDSFRSLQEFHRETGGPSPRMAHCTSLNQFYALVNDFRPDFLVIDSHGRFIDNATGTEVQIGDEFLTGPEVIEKLPQIPLVFLSTCWGAPLYGCPNTIAHAFFEAGTYAVTASMLPLSVRRGGILHTRILKNLITAAVKPMHPSWSAFVSHTIRTSCLTDMRDLIKHVLGVDEMASEYWVEGRSRWFAESSLPGKRIEVFKRAKETLAAAYDEGIRPAVLEVLDSDAYTPDFMFYSTMGRADLVNFESWNAAHHDVDQISLSVPLHDLQRTRE